jgi:hypothetical protein
MATLQDILRAHLERTVASQSLSAPQIIAARALAVCRSAVLGGHVQRCPHGHQARIWYNSCRHRACPQCNGLSRERWLSRLQARLIDCAHHHLIFTIDHQLNVLWRLNSATMMNALFGSVRDTLVELLGDARYLGARPGMVLALHTWRRSLWLHPHIHALVSDGGWDGARWVAPRRSHFLPARVVMGLFRGKLLAELGRLQRAGQLRLPRAYSAERFTSLLNRLGRKKWNVHLRTRYGHGQGVSRYLARYVKGGALSNRQIVRANAHEVLFGYAAHGEEGTAKRCLMSLHPEQFIARVLMHTPEPHRHTVRYYGLYAHGATSALNQARGARSTQGRSTNTDQLAKFLGALAWVRAPRSVYAMRGGFGAWGHNPRTQWRTPVGEGAQHRCALDRLPAYSGDVGTAFRSMSVRDSDLMSVRRTDGR